MLRHSPSPASDGSVAPVVAFDFDGTLTCRDSFIAFLRWRSGAVGFAARLPILAPDLLAYCVHRDRGLLKAAFASSFFGGSRRAQLAEEARRFAAERFESLIRPDALACWRAWKELGARLYIVTASPEILVAPFADRIGADGLIGTRLAYDAHDRFAGGLEGPNCRGDEKVARLRELLGPNVKLAAAYGDTSGDREMLALAERPGFKVFTGLP